MVGIPEGIFSRFEHDHILIRLPVCQLISSYLTLFSPLAVPICHIPAFDFRLSWFCYEHVRTDNFDEVYPLVN